MLLKIVKNTETKGPKCFDCNKSKFQSILRMCISAHFDIFERITLSQTFRYCLENVSYISECECSSNCKYFNACISSYSDIFFFSDDNLLPKIMKETFLTTQIRMEVTRFILCMVKCLKSLPI